MGTKLREEIYKKAGLKWGESSQIIVAIEELSELINQLSKHLNGKCKDMAHIVDELADSRIMIEQMEFIFGVQEDVIQRFQVKILKLDDIVTGRVNHPHKSNHHESKIV